MNENLLKRDNETELEYIKRIVFGKLVDKNIEEDYVELAPIIFGQELSSCECRKRFYGAKSVLEKINTEFENNISDDNILRELEEKKKEIEKEKVKFQDQKREYRNFLRMDARWEHLEQEIIKAIDNLNVKMPLIGGIDTKPKSQGDNEATLILSDWHIGLEADNYWNKYSIEIAKERVNKLTKKTIQYCVENQVKILHIELLGDLCNGLIHISTRIFNEEDVISQVMTCSEILSEMINELSKHMEIINIYSSTGNHGRVSANVKENIDVENFERLIPWYLKARVKCTNVNFIENEFDSELIAYKIYGQYIFALHGHHDKPNGVVDNWAKMLKIFPKEVHLGHYHSQYEREEYDILVSVNGSLSGIDQYAKEIRKSGSPFQKLIIYRKDDEDSCTYRIKL